MPKFTPQQLDELYHQTLAEFAASPEKWTSFLDTAARLYKYDFKSQVLIWSQRPDATACAELPLWNDRLHRRVNRGSNGIGIVDIVENRVVGMKSRGVYETPGGTILMAAHEQLEELTLDRDTMETKKKLGSQFAQVVYEGKWYTPLREAIQAFVDVTQKYVTGEVKFKLFKGNIIKAGESSPYSLYNESLASFTTGDLYDHHDASGFITLFGLPLKVRAMKMQEVETQKK